MWLLKRLTNFKNNDIINYKIREGERKMENNIFRTALAGKYRFEYKGNIGVEDLFDLSEKALNEIYKNLLKQKKDNVDESLFSTANEADKELETKILILQDIATYKKELKEKVQNEEYNRKIDRLIREKQEELMKNASIEELQAMKK